MLIFNQKPKLEWLDGAPKSSHVTAGEQHTTLFGSSPNGGTNKELMMAFLVGNFTAKVGDPGPCGTVIEHPWEGRVVDASPEKPIVLICDWHG
eukprot:3763630-Rhodomonas_salina.1